MNEGELELCLVRTLTFVSHLDSVFSGVVVDENSCSVVCSRLQNLLFKGAVASLHQRHPVDAPGGNQEVSVRVTSLPVHHCGDQTKVSLVNLGPQTLEIWCLLESPHCLGLALEL